MLDVYQVQGIVKQSQAEIRQKFEQDHPDIVEFLAKAITDESKKGHTMTDIFVPCRFQTTIDKNLFEDYLCFKGFFVKILWSDDKQETLSEWHDEKRQNLVLRVSWPKG